ncbi:unnamed protein product [Rotaria sordida]|uniref:PDZ domain-containing protein n=1 Tax=Rotaria sordida TaxID=392033 RepID=A0A814RV51_9BILA|nr:unnamed protein product [Rotaria sordida]CAF1139370.1 unnamed protein product [Rotaria sordida]
MAVVLQNRTISMILMVPDVPVLAPLSSPIIENLNQSDIDQSFSISKHDPSSNIDITSSIPVYHGSIVRIEQHNNDQNTSDLIVRVPNFQRLSLPLNKPDNKQQTRIKRRAPICPILSTSNQRNNSNSSNTNAIDNFNKLNRNQLRVASTSRLATGLRSLSRAFTHGCKSKRSSSMNEINVLPALPDVEVMTEKVETSITSRKTTTHENLTSTIPKLTTPKILFIKRKHFKIKHKQPSSTISIDKQPNLENNRIDPTSTSTIITTQYIDVNKNNSTKITSFCQPIIEQNDLNQQTDIIEQDDDKEQQTKSSKFNYEDQQFTTISRLISDIPASSIDGDSLSTHRYSTISVIVPDNRNSIIDNNAEGVSLSEQLSTIILPTSTGTSYDIDNKATTSVIHNMSPKIHRPFRIQTSVLQPDISVIRIGTTDLTTELDRLLPGEKLSNGQLHSIPKNQLDIEQKQNDDNRKKQDRYGITQANDETFAECYEVTYQIDPQYEYEKEQITNQSFVPIKINLDPFEYKDLTSTLTTLLPFISQNEYEQIENDNDIHQNKRKYQQIKKRNHSFEHLVTIPKEKEILINNIRRMKSHSIDDLSRTNNDQTSPYQVESISSSSSSKISSRQCTLQRSNSYNGFGIYVSTDRETHREHFICQVEQLSPGEHAGLKENDRILCINGTPVINEEYTVVLQLIKHGLQTDTLNFDVITNDVYEEFKSQIDQLYQGIKI